MVKKVTINDTPLDNVVVDKPVKKTVKRTIKKQEIKEEESDINESDIDDEIEDLGNEKKDWSVGILDLVCDMHGNRKKESFNKYDKIMDDCKKTVNFHMNLKDDEDDTKVLLPSYEKKDDGSVKWILTMMTYLLMMNIEIHLFDIEQGLKKLPELYEIVKLIERYEKTKNRDDYEKLRKFFNEDNHPLF